MNELIVVRNGDFEPIKQEVSGERAKQMLLEKEVVYELGTSIYLALKGKIPSKIHRAPSSPAEQTAHSLANALFLAGCGRTPEIEETEDLSKLFSEPNTRVLIERALCFIKIMDRSEDCGIWVTDQFVAKAYALLFAQQKFNADLRFKDMEMFDELRSAEAYHINERGIYTLPKLVARCL